MARILSSEEVLKIGSHAHMITEMMQDGVCSPEDLAATLVAYYEALLPFAQAKLDLDDDEEIVEFDRCVIEKAGEVVWEPKTLPTEKNEGDKGMSEDWSSRMGIRVLSSEEVLQINKHRRYVMEMVEDNPTLAKLLIETMSAYREALLPIANLKLTLTDDQQAITVPRSVVEQAGKVIWKPRTAIEHPLIFPMSSDEAVHAIASEHAQKGEEPMSDVSDNVDVSNPKWEEKVKWKDEPEVDPDTVDEPEAGRPCPFAPMKCQSICPLSMSGKCAIVVIAEACMKEPVAGPVKQPNGYL